MKELTLSSEYKTLDNDGKNPTKLVLINVNNNNSKRQNNVSIQSSSYFSIMYVYVIFPYISFQTIFSLC